MRSFLLIVLIVIAPLWATDARLPDGTKFQSPERPLMFSRTHCVDNRCTDSKPGTSDRPFRTMSQAAKAILYPKQRSGRFIWTSPISTAIISLPC